MLTYEDCVDLSGLTEEEIDAIAEHEHVPGILALELGHYLLKTDDGVPAIKRIILDDIDAAKAAGNFEHASKLKAVLHHFISTHPSNPKK
ncbi:MAG: hypothetical protein COB89_07015 [Piscirickettsiaceae bacterium]|nr:MAG: hypothetical protein COB89_07015 [Piscirickettsiaceae bacterium]